MTIQDLQQTILQEPEKLILSRDASDPALTLAEAFDTIVKYGLSLGMFINIAECFNYGQADKDEYTGYTFAELVSRGLIVIDDSQKAYEIWEKVYQYLNDLSPDGYSFKTEGNEVGWFADLEPVTLQHVRTWMHNRVPSKRYNHASPTDALYLLDTLYAWAHNGIPVPQKYIDYLQTVVDSHKEGDGL